MAKKEFGALKKITMRDEWGSEPQGFTPWLYDNIRALGDALDMQLRAKEMEFRIGRYYLDLLAEDGDGRKVAIENQFGETDHSHLGQLLTYAVGCEADVLIWVTEEVNGEHRRTMEWLNHQNNTNAEFYLVRVEVLQIDDSRPAYQFVPVVTADKWQREAYQKASKKSPEDIACGEYFSQFVKELGGKEPSLALARQHRDSTRYRFFNSGVRDWVYVHEFCNDGDSNIATVSLYFYGERQADATALYEKLRARKEKIEKIWGISLDWEEWGWHKVGVSRPGAPSYSGSKLAEIRKWAVEQMLKLAEAIPPETLQEIAAEMEADKPKE